MVQFESTHLVKLAFTSKNYQWKKRVVEINDFFLNLYVGLNNILFSLHNLYVELILSMYTK